MTSQRHSGTEKKSNVLNSVPSFEALRDCVPILNVVSFNGVS